MSCSVHDVLDYEDRGVAAVFVASTEFVAAARAQSAALGGEPAAVFVAHPIQDRTDDEMRTLADGALDALVRAVTAG